MTQEDLQESRELYSDIDDCITELLKARTEKDQEAEGKALFRMEGLMVGTLQHLAYLIEHEEDKLPDGLDEAAEKYINDALFKWSYDDEDGIEQYVYDAFIAGAEWMKAKMMKEAVEASVNTYGCIHGGSYVEFVADIPESQFKKKDKVRIVNVKED